MRGPGRPENRTLASSTSTSFSLSCLVTSVTQRRLARGVEQPPQAGLAGLGKRLVQQLEQCAAVDLATVGIVEEAGDPAQVLQLGAPEAFLRPGDLLQRTAPRQVREQGQPRLQEGAVERCVMRDDQRDAVHDRRDARLVQPLAGHHLVRDAVDFRRLRRYRKPGILEARIDLRDPDDAAGVRLELEAYDAHLDDPVLALPGSGRFGIDHRCDAHWSSGGCEFRPHRQALQDADVRVRLEQRHGGRHGRVVLRLYLSHVAPAVMLLDAIVA